MKRKIKILSSKTLDSTQIELFTFSAEFIHCTFTEINLLNFKEDFSYKTPTFFSSLNAIKSFDKNHDLKKFNEVFIVGKKNAKYLKSKGAEKIIFENYSEDLIHKISNKNFEESQFFCGNHRLNTIPDFLKRNSKFYKEIITYESIPKHQKIDDNFDALLFFNPLSVEAFFKNNSLGLETPVFAIGKTTQKEVLKYHLNCFMPKIPSVENLIQEVNQYFEQKI